MADYIHLIGAEQVSGAGHNMSHAAAEMRSAASSIGDTMFRHQQFMTQWLLDLERVMEKKL